MPAVKDLRIKMPVIQKFSFRNFHVRIIHVFYIQFIFRGPRLPI